MGRVVESIELRYQKGTSDKVYHVSLESVGSGYVVNFGYGRRGGTINTGTKTRFPVDIVEAERIYSRLVKSKQAKGYQVWDNVHKVIPVADSVKEDTGIYPQLSMPVAEDASLSYIVSNDWCAQEKYDGRRMLVRKEPGNRLTCINRRGLVTSCPNVVSAMLKCIAGTYVMDGELVGESYHVFDALEYCGFDLRDSPYTTRLGALADVFRWMPQGDTVSLVPTVTGHASKQAFVEQMREENREGVIFKHLHAHWYAGRQLNGGASFKLKFWESCSCVVLGVNSDRRSVVVGLDGASIGNVTIPPNHAVPDVGRVVEVRYLYVNTRGGSLYQPVYLGVRNDVLPAECTFGRQRLKYKAA